jgi:Lrp/AsnC family transcriptional regulator, leucine-responsive regulatory protein
MSHRQDGAQQVRIDKKDRQIISALQIDARQSLAALGRRIGLSQPAISERVKRLEESGVIEGYAARINLRAIGYSMQAVIRIKTTHEHISKYVQLFLACPEVLDAVRVTGEDCFIVRCAIADPSDLERIVDSLAKYGSVSTSLVLSHPVSKVAAVT